MLHTPIDTAAIRAELEGHPDGEPISAIWASNTVTTLCDEVDRLTRELEASIARDCPRGDDCDLTVAYMAGERRAEDRLREALASIFLGDDSRDRMQGDIARAALNGGADD